MIQVVLTVVAIVAIVIYVVSSLDFTSLQLETRGANNNNKVLRYNFNWRANHWVIDFSSTVS